MKKILLFSILALFFVAPLSLIKAQTYQSSTTTTTSGTSQMITVADIKAIAPQLLQTLNQLSTAIGNKQNQIERDRITLGQSQAQQEQAALDQVINNVSNIISLFSNLVSTLQK